MSFSRQMESSKPSRAQDVPTCALRSDELGFSLYSNSTAITSVPAVAALDRHGGIAAARPVAAPGPSPHILIHGFQTTPYFRAGGRAGAIDPAGERLRLAPNIGRSAAGVILKLLDRISRPGRRRN